MKKITNSILFLCVYLFICSTVLAQVEKIERAETGIRKEEVLRERIEKKKVTPKIEEEKQVPMPAMEPSAARTLITNIEVTGVTLIPQADIDEIIKQYENKELSVNEMQQVADLITDIYRKEGYVTSRAYLPPQRIATNKLEIKVVEGLTGDITITGNKYFKTPILRKKINLKTGEPFNYEVLRKGMTRINQKSDREAKAVLNPGKQPATTDVYLEVKDSFPIHIGFDWDNYGSRYIEKNRYRVTLTHNNLLGFDDVFNLQFQTSEGDHYKLFTARYLLPVSDSLRVGFFAADSRLNLGKEFEDLDATGKSRLFSFFALQTLIETENTQLVLDFGFDYKNVFNNQSGVETSADRLRMATLGADLDVTDDFGRTLVSHLAYFGIPNIMGGSDSQDALASRAGSGGQFVKNTFNFLRLNRMPFNSMALMKSQIQLSPNILPAAEQFQIGGIANVRGYPPAEAVGDEGYSITWEWSFPVYFLPKDIKAPFSKGSLYDALRIVGFYDWANVRLRSPLAGEEKNTTLRGAGFGIRFNLPENVSAKVEFAWPLDRTPSDGDNLHTWFELSKTF